MVSAILACLQPSGLFGCITSPDLQSRALQGLWVSRLLSLFGDKEARILVLGLDNAGKTTILCEPTARGRAAGSTGASGCAGAGRQWGATKLSRRAWSAEHSQCYVCQD